MESVVPGWRIPFPLKAPDTGRRDMTGAWEAGRRTGGGGGSVVFGCEWSV